MKNWVRASFVDSIELKVLKFDRKYFLYPFLYPLNQIVRHKFPQDEQYCDVLFYRCNIKCCEQYWIFTFFLVPNWIFCFRFYFWCIESCQKCNANDRSSTMCTFSHKTLFAFDAFCRSLDVAQRLLYLSISFFARTRTSTLTTIHRVHCIHKCIAIKESIWLCLFVQHRKYFL